MRRERRCGWMADTTHKEAPDQLWTALHAHHAMLGQPDVAKRRES